MGSPIIRGAGPLGARGRIRGKQETKEELGV